MTTCPWASPRGRGGHAADDQRAGLCRLARSFSVGAMMGPIGAGHCRHDLISVAVKGDVEPFRNHDYELVTIIGISRDSPQLSASTLNLVGLSHSVPPSVPRTSPPLFPLGSLLLADWAQRACRRGDGDTKLASHHHMKCE